MAKHWTTATMISLFYHESGHSWDNQEQAFKVHHGSNSPVGKENTFQYSLNRYVYEYLDYKKEPRKRWYRRLLNAVFRWF